MKEIKSQNFNFNGIVERYKYLIGALLLFIIIATSIFLLWRENYFMPNIEKRINLIESRLDALTQNKIANSSAVPVKVDELISASKESGSANTDTGKVAGANATDPQPSKAAVKQITAKVNINSGSEAELDTLPGIGPAYAKRIIEYRQSHNGFKSIAQIKEIKGIGDSIFNKIKDLITI